MPYRKTDIFTEVSNQLYAYIDKHGLRHTTERMVILEAICRLKSFTVDELRDVLTHLKISRATVYNTLTLLVDANIIRRLDKEFGTRAIQYELVRISQSSVQVICTRCGRVSKIKDSTIQRMLADKRWSNFELQHLTLYVYGKCKVCRKKTQDKPT